MPRISVIIPVYNTAPFLRQCLDSVLSQTFSDIEIIAIDDGSTDGSARILQEYAAKDSRITLMNRQHQYAGAARNAGLTAATGEYVIFWDGDDYFKNTALEEMYVRLCETDADICICNAQDFDSESGELLYHNYLRKPLPETEVFNIDSFPKYFFTFTSSITWNKLIRRSIFTDNDIKFDNIQHINDVTGIFLAMAHAKRIVLLNKKLVFYRMNRSGSLMATYGEQAGAVFTAYSRLKAELEARGLLHGGEIRQSFNNKVWDILIFSCRYCNSYATFESYVERLKNEWLPRLEMAGLSTGYFYNADRGRQYEFLLRHTAGDFLFNLFCFQSDLSKKRAQQAQRMGAESKKLQKQNERQLWYIEKLREKEEKLRGTLKAERALSRQWEKEAAGLKKQSARRLVRFALKISNFWGRVKKRFTNGS